MIPSSTTSFVAYHYPALDAGEYFIEQKLELVSDYTDRSTYNSDGLRIFVAGERFIVAPNLVYSTFPPKDNEGLYTAVLPHIELVRSTLPWERNAERNDSQERVPWLALLVIEDDELDGIKAQLGFDKISNYIKLHNHHKELEIDADSTDIPLLLAENSFLKTLLPTEPDLKLLTHVRVVKNKDEVSMSHIPSERAVIVANRMPAAGKKYTALLVSLESRYTNGQFDYKTDDNGWVQLPILHNWNFTSVQEDLYKADEAAVSRLQLINKEVAEPSWNETIKRLKQLSRGQKAPLVRGRQQFLNYLTDHKVLSKTTVKERQEQLLKGCTFEAATLRSLLQNLNTGPFQLPLFENNVKVAEINKYLRLGAVALPHKLRAGGNTVSWFRGPLVPLHLTFPAPDKEITQQHSDELMQFNTTTGLLDATYAAAWELGRLLFINEPKLIQQLQRWKLEYLQELKLAQQRADFPHLSSFMVKTEQQLFPGPIADFLGQFLKLKNIPYNYLVADDRLLPEESLRFFQVDELWLKALMYGALSLGESITMRKTNEIIETIIANNTKHLSYVTGGKAYAIHGVLVRSDAVSGWPGLQAEAYSEQINVPLFHKTYLSDNVMLCLFANTFDRLVFYLPRGAAHFGFEQRANQTVFFEQGSGRELIVRKNDLNCVDFGILSQEIQRKTSVDLALALLHKQDKIIFDIKAS